jgi:hypothetical protein
VFVFVFVFVLLFVFAVVFVLLFVFVFVFVFEWSNVPFGEFDVWLSSVGPNNRPGSWCLESCWFWSSEKHDCVTILLPTHLSACTSTYGDAGGKKVQSCAGQQTSVSRHWGASIYTSPCAEAAGISVMLFIRESCTFFDDLWWYRILAL